MLRLTMITGKGLMCLCPQPLLVAPVSLAPTTGWALPIPARPAVGFFEITDCPADKNSLYNSHCENGSFEVLSLHLPSVAVDRRQL